MSGPRLRWTLDPHDEPARGEVLARTWHTTTRHETRTMPDGREISVTVLGGFKISVEDPDGRRLVADVPASDDDRAAPLVESDAPRDLVDALDRAWRAAAKVGRPAGLTTIPDEEALRKPIREMRRDKRRITRETVAAYSGYTVAEIRGYLRSTRRTWTEFLASF